jgi:hypothetical protein
MKFEKINPDENSQKRIWNKIQEKITAEESNVKIADPNRITNKTTVFTKNKSAFWVRFASVAVCLAIAVAVVFTIIKDFPNENPGKLTEGTTDITTVSTTEKKDTEPAWKSIKTGTTEEEVIKILGDDFILFGSGIERSIWRLDDGTKITIFFGGNEKGERAVSVMEVNGEWVQPLREYIDIVPVNFDENTPLGEGEWVLDYAFPFVPENSEYEIFNSENYSTYGKRIIFHNAKIGIFLADVDENNNMKVVKSLDLSVISADSEDFYIRPGVSGNEIRIRVIGNEDKTWEWSHYDDFSKLSLITDTTGVYYSGEEDAVFFDASKKTEPNPEYGNVRGIINPNDNNFISYLYVADIAENSEKTFKNITYTQQYVGEKTSENAEIPPNNTLTWFPFQ